MNTVRYAEHIIGLEPLEVARPDEKETVYAVRKRFATIWGSGELRPYGRPRQIGEGGSTFGLDYLAGDSQYVFLSYGPRYRLLRPEHLCYGFAFDARQLVVAGALVGVDMLDVYEDILDEIVQAIDARLPPLPPVSDEELAEFAGLFGEHDPEMLAFIKEQSSSRYWDIYNAVVESDTAVEGATEARERFLMAATEAQVRERKAGREALALLDGEEMLEIVVPGPLSLDQAVGVIKAGELCVF